MAVTLTDEQFARLYEYLEREHSPVWSPEVVGKTTKIGKLLWDEVRQVAADQGFEPTHEPIAEF